VLVVLKQKVINVRSALLLHVVLRNNSSSLAVHLAVIVLCLTKTVLNVVQLVVSNAAITRLRMVKDVELVRKHMVKGAKL